MGLGDAQFDDRTVIRFDETATNSPSGTPSWIVLSPQHVIVPSWRSPHERRPPAAMAANGPCGASDGPAALSPQQMTDSSARSPHE